MTTPREEWLVGRRTGIGGSDIAAIAGVNPYAGPLDVYLDKLGISAPKEETSAMKLGTKLEPVIAELYSEETGKQLIHSTLVRHPVWPWALGTPDRLVVNEPLGVELKTVGLRSAHLWGEEEDAIPPHYLLQCQWYMSITGLPHWDIAVLIGGQDLRIFHLHEDVELQATLLDIGERFWRENVQAQQLPPIDSSDAYATYLADKYRSYTPALVKADQQAESWVAGLTQARKTIRACEEQAQLAENNLKDLIGDNAGILGDGWKVTWKKSKDTLVTNWKDLAQEFTLYQDLIDRFTTTKEGSRRFLFTPNKESRNGK